MYYFDKDGNITEEYNEEYTELTDEQIIFKHHHPEAKDSEVMACFLESWEDMVNEVAEEQAVETVSSETSTLEALIRQKVREINAYNNSDNVNTFTYNGISLWIDKDTRNTFMTSILSADARGENTIIAPLMGGMEIPLQTAKGLLVQLQGYCDKAGVAAYQAQEAVKKLTTILEVEQFDYKSLFPQPLEF